MKAGKEKEKDKCDNTKKILTNDEIINSIFYTYDPPGMIRAMQTLLQESLQIPKENIKVEEFTGSAK